MSLATHTSGQSASQVSRQADRKRAAARLLALAAAASLASVTWADSGTWTNTASGNWGDIVNWGSGSGPVADGSGFTADFSTIDPTADVTVTLEAARTIGSLTFGDTDTATAAGWTLTDGANLANVLTLDGTTPTVTVNALGGTKALTVDAILAGTAGMTKAGAGNLNLNRVATFTGGLNLNGGTITIGTNGGINTTAANPITFNGGGISTGSSSGLANPMTLTAGSSGRLWLRNGGTVNPISGSGTMTIGTAATKTVTLAGNWGTAFTAGTLVFDGGNGSSNGTFRLRANGGSFAGFNASTEVRLVNRASAFTVTYTNGSTVTMGALSGDASSTLQGGGTGGTATYNIGGMGTTTTFAGSIVRGNGLTLNKVGTGTLVLTQSSVDTLLNVGLLYDGVTNVNGGTLQIDGYKYGAGAVNVNSGGTLAGTGTVAGQVTVNSGGHVAPATGTSVGTLTLTGGLTLNAGAVIDAEFGAASNDSLIIANALTVNGGKVNLLDEGGATAFSTNGTYNLIQYGTIDGLGAAGLGVLNPQSGKNYSFATAGNTLTLEITDAGGPVYWNKTTGGSWGGANWTSAAPDGQGAFAGFGGGGTAIGGPATVTLDGDKRVGTVSFNNGTHRFTVAQGTGGSLILDNGSTNAAITVAAGSHAITAPVTLSTTGNDVNVVSASDSVTLAGAVAGAGPLTNVGAGTLVLAAANPGLTGTVSAATGTLEVGNANALQAATLAGGAGVVTASAGVTSVNVGTLGSGTITVNSPVQVTVGAGDASTTFAGALAGSATLVKTGAGTLTLAGQSSNAGGLAINGGTVTVRAGQTAAGTSVGSGATLEIATTGWVTGDIQMGDGSTFRMLPTGSGGDNSIFPGNAIVLGSGATATLTSPALGNGYNGPVTGDATSVLSVTGQTSMSAGNNTKQLANMLGTVRVESGAMLRFGGSTNLGNGGDQTTFEVIGTLTTRNGGLVSLGAVSGNGTIQGPNNAAGTATFDIGAKGNDHVFAGSIVDGTAADRIAAVRKVGTGTLVLSGANTYTGTTSARAGTLVLQGAARTPVTTLGGADIIGGNLVLDYAGESTPLPDVLAALKTGFETSPSFTTGKYRSSTAGTTRGIAWVDDAAGSKLTLSQQLFGDLDFSGTVDADDYVRLDRNVATGAAATWVNGDMNYDGVIGEGDYLLVDTAFIATGAPAAETAALLTQREAQFGEAYVASLIAAVPEPTGLGLAGVAAAGLLGRRRRTR